MTEALEGEILDAVDESTEPVKKFSLGRSSLKLIATSSVRFVVSSAITTLVPVKTKKERRKVFVASMVLSGMVNEQVKPYVDREIGEAIEMAREVIKHVKRLEAQLKDQSVPTTCLSCKGSARMDPTQENTIYCDDPDCAFMGVGLNP